MSLPGLPRAPITSVAGIGAARAQALSRLGVTTVGDLMLHLPREYEDRRRIVPIAEAAGTERAVIRATVVAHDYFGRKRTLKVYVRDESGVAALLCFGREFLKGTLTPGRELYVAGEFTYRYSEIQASQFEFEPYSPNPRRFGRILPIYPLTEGVTQLQMREYVSGALRNHLSVVKDVVPRSIADVAGLLPRRVALESVHRPGELTDADAARRSLAWEELFVSQLQLARQADGRRRVHRELPPVTLALQHRLKKALPFSLTADQERVLGEITEDLRSPHPMVRLLQGDVGSGKTLVALLAALVVVERNEQVAIMAPTELLARQHAANAAKLLNPLGIRLALLSGKVDAQARRPLEEALASGEVDIVFGTHALFSERVAFHALGFVIVDEQHRFGVKQREALLSKGENPDLLLMTATPIPRTLAMTAFGDMEVSTIREMPPGRKPVKTHLARHGNEEKVYSFVERELAKGHRAYFVYPRIEATENGGEGSSLPVAAGERENGGLKDVTSMYETLRSRFPGVPVGMIHSRVEEEEKGAIMERFEAGDIQLLVATSVVEVGVDVPVATVMVIEHAERFGLAALHQLRGRVGRSERQSYCFLVYSATLTEVGKERLRTMHGTNDGFEIAEEDLRLRGPGEFEGVRQSGYLRLQVADLSRDLELMLDAREAAATLVRQDPGLLSPGNRALRTALAIQEGDE
ncbi:MAG: ATP-dependent DNA helicase RecG [Spirochaetaceae bacterium]